MKPNLIMRGVVWGSLLAIATGCATTVPLAPAPLNQDQLDAFLKTGRDARQYGITLYSGSAGTRFEFANRVHPHRSAQMDFMSPRSMNVPVIRGRTGRFVDCQVLVDSSARHNWLLLQSAEAMDYRVFAPPLGQYPDHAASAIPGYAGVANKLVLDKLHMESPVFYVMPARGGFGPLARADGQSDASAPARMKLARTTHVVLGAAALQAFSYVQFDFDARTVRFSTDRRYAPPAPSAVLADVPLRDWRGRPAVAATLGGRPLTLVLDTAGEFDLALPGGGSADAPLVIGDWVVDDIDLTRPADHGLPEDFPARLGLGLLARHTVTLDFKQQRLWIEDRTRLPAGGGASGSPAEPDAPVHYQGIVP